jgi:hypothetical protein
LAQNNDNLKAASTRVSRVIKAPDPEFAGEMRITSTMTATKGGTEATILCEDIPKGVRLEDNEEGTRLSLQKLAALLE